MLLYRIYTACRSRYRIYINTTISLAECMVLERTAQKSVHRTSDYTVMFSLLIAIPAIVMIVALWEPKPNNEILLLFIVM